jgi:hypothetical protein
MFMGLGIEPCDIRLKPNPPLSQPAGLFSIEVFGGDDRTLG